MRNGNPHKRTSLFCRLFKNSAGKIVIWQSPNVPLWGWIFAVVLGFVFKHGNFHSGIQQFGRASLFVWAYLEIREGESIFRRILGAIVMASLISSFFIEHSTTNP